MYEMVILTYNNLNFPHMNCTQIAEKVWEIKKKNTKFDTKYRHISYIFVL